eukprot:2613057-Pyramimonas_sp.AAC.1
MATLKCGHQRVGHSGGGRGPRRRGRRQGATGRAGGAATGVADVRALLRVAPLCPIVVGAVVLRIV